MAKAYIYFKQQTRIMCKCFFVGGSDWIFKFEAAHFLVLIFNCKNLGAGMRFVKARRQVYARD